MASGGETRTETAQDSSTIENAKDDATAARIGDSNDEDQERIEYNPRWMGYLCITVFSGINFLSISNLSGELRRRVWASSMPFGILTFLIGLLILIQDRWRKKFPGFNFAKMMKGYVEGFILLLSVLWWIVGVAFITRPGGIAYTVSNIYFSAWLTVFACVYTLNEWSDSKNILTIAEITSVSFTLRYWWIHFTAAFVVFLSSCSLEVQLDDASADKFIVGKHDALFGICVGLLSMITSSCFIMVHYNFITCIEEGGWIELLSNGIAATTSGFDCIPRQAKETYGIVTIHNCTIVRNGIAEPCRFGRYIPGSNLYFACWACMLSSIAIALKWKAAKALKFAQSKAEQEQQQQALEQAVGGEEYEDADDNDDDDSQ